MKSTKTRRINRRTRWTVADEMALEMRGKSLDELKGLSELYDNMRTPSIYAQERALAVRHEMNLRMEDGERLLAA